MLLEFDLDLTFLQIFHDFKDVPPKIGTLFAGFKHNAFYLAVGFFVDYFDCRAWFDAPVEGLLLSSFSLQLWAKTSR